MDEPRAPLLTYEDLSKRIYLPLLDPRLNEVQVHEGCRRAEDLGCGGVIVRPSDADLAVRWLDGSGALVAGAVGFPSGSSTTPTKLYETQDLLRRGVREIEAVLNIGKLVSRQFTYVEAELQQLCDACHQREARLKVVFETAFLTDEHKIVAMRICKLTGVDVVKTGTGFAPGATVEEVAFLKKRLKDRVAIEAEGAATVEAMLACYEAGAERFAGRAAVRALEEWKAMVEQRSKISGERGGEQPQSGGEA